MIPALHFFALVGLVGATAVAAARSFQRPRPGRVALALGVGGGVSLVVGAMSAHACGNGQAVSQWVVPGACAAASLALVKAPWLRRGLASVSLLLALVLSFHYGGVVHGSRYIGTSPPPHYESCGAETEWHTWLTGLYRRTPPDADALPFSSPEPPPR